MLHVNDDMDELFRQAAENYPLNTDSAEWGKVHNNLVKNNSASSGRKYFEPDKKYWFLLLLLLIPLIWLANNYFSLRKQVTTQNQLKKSSPINHAVANVNNPSISFQKHSIIATSKEVQKAVSSNHDGGPGDNRTSNITKTTEKQNTRKIISTDKASIIEKQSVNGSNGQLLSKPYTSKTTIINPDVVVISRDEETKLTESGNQSTLVPVKEKTGHKYEGDIKSVITAKNLQQPDKNATFSTQQDKVTINDKKHAKRESFFYAGLIAGVDESTVKLQNIMNSGFQGGMLIGYSFNKRLSVESGLLLDKKYYYTDGRYFNSKELYLQGPAKLVDVTGNCNMLEVPLNLKYNFTIEGNNKWFSILGLSSYFMKNQSYNYGIQYNNYLYQKHTDYSKSSNSIFSVINLGAGLNYDLGKKISIRFEPYIKIPLQGIGVGNLPITSAGLNLGITKKF